MLTFKRKLILTQAQANRLDSWMGVPNVGYNNRMGSIYDLRSNSNKKLK